MEKNKVEDIKNVNWGPLPYEVWENVVLIDLKHNGYEMFYRELRENIKKILQKLCDDFKVSFDELEKVFWSKNPKISAIRENDWDCFKASPTTEPFKELYDMIFFPMLDERKEIDKIIAEYNSLSFGGKANLLNELGRFNPISKR
jgi:ssDNA-specific exonuclease RecJ